MSNQTAIPTPAITVPTGAVPTPATFPQNPMGTAVPMPVTGFTSPEVSNINNAGVSGKEEQMAAIAYIAGQCNYFMKNVIYSKVAIQAYRDAFKANEAKPEGEKIKQAPYLKPDLSVDETKKEPVSFTQEYSQAKFRSLCKDKYLEIKNAGYTKVVLAETKPEFIVIKNLISRNGSAEEQQWANLTEKLSDKASAKNLENGIFVIKRKELVAIMTATHARYIPIICPGNTDVTRPNGYIITKAKDSANGKVYDLIYIKRDTNSMRTQVNTLIELGMPYAINKCTTENIGSIGDLDKVTNREQVEKLYGPNFPWKTLGTRRPSKKSDYPDEKAFEAYKADILVKFAKKGLGVKFEQIGLTESDVEQLRKKGGRSSSKKTQSIEDLFQQHIQNIQVLSNKSADAVGAYH